MNATEFKNKVDSSFNMKLIVTGITGLVEHEGYTPHEAFQLVEHTKQNIAHALMEIGSEKDDTNK